ncbi:MAG: hypothetical protein H0X13_11440 [Ramlibacter sp.]|nr:hypothetical protein [Ramlibacter sp.]
MSAYSREHVFHLLAQAAELEHNILCSYLYAAFSLKRSTAEGLPTQQLEAVNRWRSELMQVCVEEMVHLAQVSNLLLAVGSRPHLNRPNLPPRGRRGQGARRGPGRPGGCIMNAQRPRQCVRESQ